jgi:hypothetical protein
MPPISQEQRSQIISLLKAGEDDRNQIAQKVGVSPQTVSAIKAHLTMRTYDQAPPSKEPIFRSAGITIKRCPECNRTYGDETISFCLADGSLLSAPFDPTATQVLPKAFNPSPTPTIRRKEPGRTLPISPRSVGRRRIGAKDFIRNILISSGKFRIEEGLAEGYTRATLRTALSDLKNSRYCGNGDPLNIKKADDGSFILITNE